MTSASTSSGSGTTEETMTAVRICQDSLGARDHDPDLDLDLDLGDDNDTSPCVEVLLLPDLSLSFAVHGILSPPIILLTIVTNSLVCLVLLKKSMRGPTNALLVAMAMSDMLTGLLPLPCYLYFYTLGNYRDWVPYLWCFPYHCLTNYVPTVFHTASIWLTVALATHRYVCVCMATVAKRWCTISNVVKVIVAVYAVAFASQLTRFVENDFVPVELRSLVDGRPMVGCIETHSAFVRRNENIYFNVYYWFRVVFIHLVPCLLLIALNALLVQTMRSAHARRAQLLKQNRKSECRRLADSNVTTLMLVVVVGVFLVVELPMALLFIVMIVDNTFDLGVIDEEANYLAPVWINLFIMLSYPVNFFIYCAMSRQFRETFRKMMTFGRGGRGGGTGEAEQEDSAGGRDRMGLTAQTNCLATTEEL